MIKKYYRITAKTPYCGETQDYYIVTEDYNKVLEFASDCVDDNANEWYDDEAAGEEYNWHRRHCRAVRLKNQIKLIKILRKDYGICDSILIWISW